MSTDTLHLTYPNDATSNTHNLTLKYLSDDACTTSDEWGSFVEPAVRCSTSSDDRPLSPPPSASLKRRSHIRKKDPPKRLRKIERHDLLPLVVSQTAESHQVSQQPTPPPSTRRGTRSRPPRGPRPPSVSNKSRISAPINLRQKEPVQTDFSVPASSRSPAYNPPLSAPNPQRQWSLDQTEFAMADSTYYPPLSAPIQLEPWSPRPSDLLLPDSPSSLAYTPPFSAPIHLEPADSDLDDSQVSISPSSSTYDTRPLRIWKLDRADVEILDSQSIAIPDSPSSVYSVMTTQGTGCLQVDWDTTGYLKANWEDRRDTNDLQSKLDAWLVPENEVVGLTRQRTEVIVELLRLRRRKAGME